MASANNIAAQLLGLEQVRECDGSLVAWNTRGGALLPSSTGS
jgi:hypothetical protein